MPVAHFFIVFPGQLARSKFSNKRSKKNEYYGGFMLSLGRLPVALALVVAGALLAGAPSNAQSRDWPTRPVRLILPLGPGSGADITARMLADRLMARWGQPVIVENKPGGDAILAITTVLNAHDDHVLLYSPTSSFTAHPLLHEKVPYNVNDLEPIARTTTTLIGFGVPASLGVSKIKDFVAKVRAAPGKLNYASATGANDLMFASFLKIEKLDMSKVPYRDPVQPINDLAEGRVQAYVGAYAILRPQIEAGKIKMLALTNPSPAPSMPDIPTATQEGYKDLTIDGLAGLFGPRGMPLALRQHIAADVRDVLADKIIGERLTAVGLVVSPGGPADLASALAGQQQDVVEIGKILDIKMAQ
jgi:tripartite-type tricarboxylate transporter receptor subunit TctC